MADYGFLGKGMKFPPQINMATGRFVTVSETESVKESVYLILMTQQGERFVRPDFGSSLMSYTFMDINPTSLSLMVRNLTEQILLQEPRVRDVRIVPDPNVRNGRLLIQIDYTISSSNTRDNLVFPFYLNAAAEDRKDEDHKTD